MSTRTVRTWLIVVAVAISVSTPAARAQGGLHAENLRCEYRANPLGVDVERPRLSWIVESDEQNARQTACRILVASDPEQLAPGKADVWDSGKMETTNSVGLSYDGRPLESATRYFWKVRLWGRDGQAGPWSEPAWWETGLMKPADWKGKWISDGKDVPTEPEAFYGDDPAPLFRKEFSVGKPIRWARLYITGLGYYEASINGERIGENVLDPGWTSYDKRVYYSVYDVADQLRQGGNALGVMLGNGWYYPLPMKLFGRFNLREHLVHGRPKFIAQLVVECEDGSRDVVVSDESWSVADGPIVRNNIYLGEVYDARLEKPGWDTPDYEAEGWRSAAVSRDATGPLEAQPIPPIRVTRRIRPVAITEPEPGVYVVDMGQNFAGWTSMRVRGAKPGDRIELRYGELAHEDGTVNPMTGVACQIKWGQGGPGAPKVAYQEDTYICRGGDVERYTPRFTWHGFRYVEVKGYPGKPTLEDFEGLRLSADLRQTGHFECSNERLNAIQEMVLWTFLSNVFSVQSDCPARERFGYGGDIVATSEAFMYNFDMAAFYQKATRDFGDAVRPNGGLTEIAPHVGIESEGFGGGSGPIGWAIAHPLLQQQLHTWYGNERLIREQIGVSDRWMDFVADKHPDLIIEHGISDHEMLGERPKALTSTSFYYQSARLMEQLHSLLGQGGPAKEYAKLAEHIKKAFNDKFLSEEECRYADGSQTAQAFAFYPDGLTPDACEDKVLQVLLESIREKDDHFTVGIFGTKYLYHILTNAGRADLAYRVANQDTFPSYGHMLAGGATTLWESLKFSDNIYSHNHPMFGSVSEWFYMALGGIRPAPDAAAWDQIIIAPQVVGGLDWVKCRYDSIRGPIVSNWRVRDGRLILDVTVPGNTQALVILPTADGPRREKVGSGSYHWETKL